MITLFVSTMLSLSSISNNADTAGGNGNNAVLVHNVNVAATAAVNQVNGYFVFVYSAPVENYKIIGQVKVNKVDMQTATCFCDLSLPDMINELTKQAHKKFTDNGNAIIYSGNNIAQVVKIER